VIGCLVAIAIWVFCSIVHPLEPRYSGKRLSDWADILALSWDEYPNEKTAKTAQTYHDDAESAIHHLGTRALPYAIKWCRATNNASTENSPDWFRGKKLFGVELEEIYPGLHPSHVISATDLHNRSEEIFRILGPGAKSEIPTLINLLGDKNAGVASAAAGDLYDVGSDAVAPLILALTNQNAQIRGFAASLFEFPLPGATSAIPALSLCLNDSDSRVRLNATCALEHLGTNSPAIVVPALLDALRRETNPLNILSLIDALGQCGTNAKTAVPVLKRILESQTTTTFFDSPQRTAIFALKKIDPKAAKPFIEKWNVGLTNPL
jgi:HEAT repeat protein